MKQALHILLVLFPFCGWSQSEFVINQGTDIRINAGCEVILTEGGMDNAAGQLSNAGELVVEGNLLNQGVLAGGTTSGTFKILNDVENNGQMIPGQSTFELYGNDQQLRGSEQLHFFNLTLTGGGIKHMQQAIETAGVLDLTDRELSANSFTISHINPTPASVLATHNQGFISADVNGGLARLTNSTQAYFYPVGSTQNNFLIRPITITPSGGSNTYKVRFVPGPTPNSIQRSQELYYVNPIFYHEMHRTDGTANAEVTVFYDDIEDGLFETLAHQAGGFWTENSSTDQGPTLGTNPELVSYSTSNWDFNTPEIALAAWAKEIFVPNVFSPNDDGYNDIFKPRGTEPYAYELRIYDRWGNMVFQSNQIENGWDGRYKGKLMNSAVFVYYILAAGEVIQKGNVTLLR